MLAGTYVGGFVRVYINYRVREPPLCSQSIARLRDLRSGDWRGTRKLGGEETRKLLGEEVWVWGWKGRGRGAKGNSLYIVCMCAGCLGAPVWPETRT